MTAHKEQWKLAQQFSYVRKFESPDTLLPQCWIVLRIDGHHFTSFCDAHDFVKPNDIRCLRLMNECAAAVMEFFPDILIAYGQSDEYSFAFRPSTQVYKRRASKLVSLAVSCFTARFVMRWSIHFPDTPLRSIPSFDGRAVCYPTNRTLRDYLSWRQADCHINNLYNTCFWALVRRGGVPNAEATEQLKGTDAGQKNEILFTRFGINYAKEPEQFRKGTILARVARISESSAPAATTASATATTTTAPPPSDASPVPIPTEPSREADTADAVLPLPTAVPAAQLPGGITVWHCDIIGDAFWHAHPELLAEGER